MILAVAPFILIAIPDQLLLKKVSLSPWNTFALPLLVLMDLWMTKRCRFDFAFINRHLPVFTSLILVGGIAWSAVCSMLMKLFGIYLEYSFPAKFIPIDVMKSPLYEVFTFIIGIFQNLALFLIYRIIDTFGAEWLQNFHRFKANYLLMHHVNDTSIKDVNDLAKRQEKHYKKKTDQLDAIFAEERANLAQHISEFSVNQPPVISNEINSENLEENAANIVEMEESDTGAGVSYPSTKAKSPKSSVEVDEIYHEKVNEPIDEEDNENIDENAL